MATSASRPGPAQKPKRAIKSMVERATDSACEHCGCTIGEHSLAALLACFNPGALDDAKRAALEKGQTGG